VSLSKKVKVALDETRTLILGAQILLGFQLQGVFRPVFDRLPWHDRYLDIASLLLSSLTVGLLIAPSLHHQIVEEGDSTRRIHRTIGRFASWALAPFAVALAVDVLMAVEQVTGLWGGIAAGVSFGGLALLFWYGLELLRKRRTGQKESAMSDREEERGTTSLDQKVEQMLTETRVLLPGAQALLGFQLAITFTEAFEKLPLSSKLAHLGALGCVALTVIFLIAPAAFHRIVYQGENAPAFHDLGSRFILAASAVLALGLATDLYMVIAKITESTWAGLAAGLGTFVVLALLWHVVPLALRHRTGKKSGPSAPARAHDQHA
jgi:hypothetical protein